MNVLHPDMASVRRVTVAGNRSFEYVSQGKGPATLLVHPGGPGGTYHYLRGLLKLASVNLRVVLFNPRGVGHSWAAARPSAYTIENEAEDVEAIRRALRISELHLLGYEAGGFAALEYAHRYPQHLTSLLLCGTAGSAEEIRAANALIISCASPRQRARLRELTRAKRFDSPEYQELAERMREPFYTRFLKGVPRDLKATKINPEVYRAMMSPSGDQYAVEGTIAKWDGRKYYSKIELPCVVVVGRYDYFLGPSVAMAERIEPAHLRVLPNSSHLAILEQPREFLAIISEFLGDVTGW
ncbi:MAG TPA: alpha/beta fold hydrolase [Thermoplasmata archaeon]|nr:alpha/beta fold hydrolase [Thermoplasmata archaeon]